MPSETFHIPNISCGHCTHAVETELKALKGVSDANGDIEGKSVTVTWEEPADRGAILATLKEINYPAKESD
jgi:copper chaperone CopZ